MGSFSHVGKQVVACVVVLALVYCIGVTINRPREHEVDAADWCAGYRFGWAHENCAQVGSCAKSAPPCPKPAPFVRGTSLAAGVEAGVYLADEALGLTPDRDAPEPTELHGY